MNTNQNHTHNNQKNDNDIKRVLIWLSSFIPLIIASILFIFCFLNAHLLFLYIIMIFFFAIFVFLYIRAEKTIKQPDGYTLIQAMEFHKKCKIKKLNEISQNQEQIITATATEFDYSKDLTLEQLLDLYNTGEKLNNYFKR